MAVIEGPNPFSRLPDELIEEIYTYLELSSLPDLALTCSLLYRAFKQAEGVIIYGITARLIGPNLPLSVARYAAAQVPWKPTVEDGVRDNVELASEVERFGREHLVWNSAASSVPVKDFRYAMAQDMVSLHLAVSGWTEYLCRTSTETLDWWQPSRDQSRMVERALYIMEIIRTLLPTPAGSDEGDGSAAWDAPLDRLWECFAPWQNKQVEKILMYWSIHIQGILAPDDDAVDMNQKYAQVYSKLGLRELVFVLVHPLPPVDQLSSFRERVTALFQGPLSHYRSQYTRVADGVEWLTGPGNVRPRIRLSADVFRRLLQRYPESDKGNVVAWIYCLLDQYVEGGRAIIHELSWPNDMDTYVSISMVPCWEEKLLEDLLKSTLRMDEILPLLDGITLGDDDN